MRINASELQFIRAAKTIAVTADIRDGEIMELSLLTSALAGLFKGTLPRTELILPYLPYSRADRRFIEGDSDSLRTFGFLIGKLGYNTIKTLDVHSDAAFDHVPNIAAYDAETYIEKAIDDIGREGLALVLPDEGASRYRLDHFNLPVFQGVKKRDVATGQLSGFSIDPNVAAYDKILIVDDICDGGGTFVGLAQCIDKLAPEVELFLYVTHGIFSKGFETLAQFFEGIYTTDTRSNAETLNNVPYVTIFEVKL